MATTPPAVTDAQALGVNLRHARLTAGYVSLRSADRAIAQYMGNQAPSDETIRRWETQGLDPTVADLLTMAQIASLYNTTLSRLHPLLAVRWATIRALFEEANGALDAEPCDADDAKVYRLA